MISKRDLIKEIKRQGRAIKKGKQDYFNFLGFVEKDDLTPEVIDYFKVGVSFYNWIDGNDNLKKLIEEFK